MYSLLCVRLPCRRLQNAFTLRASQPVIQLRKLLLASHAKRKSQKELSELTDWLTDGMFLKFGVAFGYPQTWRLSPLPPNHQISAAPSRQAYCSIGACYAQRRASIGKA